MKLKLDHLILSCLIFLGINACSSPESEEDMENYDPRVHSAAYLTDTFYINDGIPSRTLPEKRIPFFYKDCSMNGHSTYYSKTSYFCESR